MTWSTSCYKLGLKGWKLEAGDQEGTMGQGDPDNQIMASRMKGR
jgi:hypothetical protein